MTASGMIGVLSVGMVTMNRSFLLLSESDTSVMAVVQSSPASSPMSMERMGKDFISKFHMPDRMNAHTLHCPPAMCFQELWWPKQGIFLHSSTEEVELLFW